MAQRPLGKGDSVYLGCDADILRMESILIECDERGVLEKVRQTLNIQEAKVITLMRDLPYQTITIKMENGKVIHKERIESIKD